MAFTFPGVTNCLPFNCAICNPHTENSFPILGHFKDFPGVSFPHDTSPVKPLSSCSKSITRDLRLSCHRGVSLCHCVVGSTVPYMLRLFFSVFPTCFTAAYPPVIPRERIPWKQTLRPFTCVAVSLLSPPTGSTAFGVRI